MTTHDVTFSRCKHTAPVPSDAVLRAVEPGTAGPLICPTCGTPSRIWAAKARKESP